MIVQKIVPAGVAAFLIALTPMPAFALTLVGAAELFNIFVGLMLTAALLLFLGGLWVYFTRLGTWPNNRDQALKIMEWGVAVLFVLILILAVVRFFQQYPKVMTTLVGIAVVLAVLGFAVYIGVNSKTEKKEH